MIRLSTRTLGLVSVLSILVLTAGCAPGGSVTNSRYSSGSNSQSSAGIAPTTPSAPATGSETTTPVVPTKPDTTMNALAWEPTVKTSNLWSAYIYSVISLEEPQMLEADSALDADLFCPRYKLMTKNQRLNFWGQLLSAMAKFESGWKPTSRMVEDMGLDAVTGKTIASEGLLQVSYQDAKYYGQSSCNFDWNKDKSLAATDPNKTILDPYKNLHCGIRIMASQLKRKQMISFESGIYWAVIKKGYARNKVDQIAAITKSLSFCTSAN